MEKVKIELNRKDAECIQRLLGCMTYYHVGATLSKEGDVDDEDVERVAQAILHTYASLDRAIAKG